jgi:hypothetical protein
LLGFLEGLESVNAARDDASPGRQRTGKLLEPVGGLQGQIRLSTSDGLHAE